MGRMRLITTIVIVVFSLIACSDTSTHERDELTEIRLIEPIAKHGEIELVEPMAIKVVSDRYLIVVDADPTAFLKVYSIPGMDHLFNWGARGRGPEEVWDPYMTEVLVVGDAIMLIEASTGIAHKYTVNYNGLTLLSTHRLRYDGMASPLNGLAYVKDDLFIVENESFEESFREYLILRIDQSDTVSSIGEFPPEVQSGSKKKSDFASRVMANPKTSEVFVFYNRHNMVAKHNLDGLNSETYRIIDKTLTESGSVLFTGSVQRTDEAMYVISANSSDDGGTISNAIIDVWDFDMNQVDRVDLGRPLTLFAISEAHRKLYATSLDEPIHILEYSIR